MHQLKLSIQHLEQQLEQPFIKKKEQPYYLHAIIIHDGLPSNGHFYTYVFDRIRSQWFRLEDHSVSVVDEATVFEEAYGDPKSYKSACTVFYINRHIIDMMNQYKPIPLYSQKFGSKLKIERHILEEINRQNFKF